MKDTHNDAVLNFVSFFKLRKDGLIVFNATIAYYKQDLLNQISSEVQIITLPQEMVLYITDYLKIEPQLPEMYSTLEFSFSYEQDKPLEIRNHPSNVLPLLTITPL